MRHILLLLLIAAPFISPAQTTTLTELTNQIAAAVKEVGDEKTSISQTFNADKGKPYRLTYTRRTTDSKGKTTEEKWEFNLADIDKNTVRWEAQKDALLVFMRISREQRLIKYFKNGELQSYTNELTLFAKGIDNARELEKTFEDAILPAQEAWEKESNIKGRKPAELLDVLFKLIGDVQNGALATRQTLEPDGSQLQDRLRLSVETFNTKGISSKEIFYWSLGDLSEQSVRLSVQNDRAFVEVKTRRNIRWIATDKDGMPGNFVNEMEIQVSDPDQGKMVQALLQKLIPFGEEQIQKRLPQPTTAGETLRLLAATQQKFTREKVDFEQYLKPDCLTQLTLKETAEKKTEVAEYVFHFGDLNEKSASLEIQGRNIKVEVGTLERNKFIGYTLNGESKNYENKVEFRFPDLEQARLFDHLLPLAIGQCRHTPIPSDFAWLNKCLSVSEKTDVGLTQKLEFQSLDASCKWKFTRIETSDKKSKEEIFEFNLYDLDPKQVSISVVGRRITLEILTKYRQKIISRYENGKPSYTSELTFVLSDIESAKVARETLMTLIEGCKQ